MKTAVINGKVYLEREKFAEAVLIEDGRILKVGSTDEVLAEARSDSSDCRVYDCGGKTVIPGLNDSHLHLVQVGETMSQARIEGVKSIDELIERCRTFMDEHPERCKHGIKAMGWNQDLFEGEKRMPTRHDLDKISTEVPIILERVCAHVLTANTKAIEMLGLDENSPQFPGGEFYKEENGYPNGIFTEGATPHVKYLIPDFTYEEKKGMLLDIMKYAARHGVTSVQSNDVGTTLKDNNEGFKMLHEVYDSGEAVIRYRHQTCYNDYDAFKEYLEEGEFVNGTYKSDSLMKLGPLKLFKDGSLGARTALMRKDYADDPGNRGQVWIPDEDMRKYIKLASEHGLQVVTHVIGDGAIKATLDNYKEEGFIDGKNKLRHGLVHCQITDKELLEEIAENEIVVLAQPIFLDYDMKIVESRCGKEMASTSYAFKTLKDMGVHVAYGTDSPVEDCNPFPVIYMAVTRKDKNGNPAGGFYPNECVDVYEAIDAYTYESAYVEFMENEKGRIKPGYLADLVVLDKDIFTCDPMEIKDILPVMTMVDGKIVYED